MKPELNCFDEVEVIFRRRHVLKTANLHHLLMNPKTKISCFDGPLHGIFIMWNQESVWNEYLEAQQPVVSRICQLSYTESSGSILGHYVFDKCDWASDEQMWSCSFGCLVSGTEYVTLRTGAEHGTGTGQYVALRSNVDVSIAFVRYLFRFPKLLQLL